MSENESNNGTAEAPDGKEGKYTSVENHIARRFYDDDSEEQSQKDATPQKEEDDTNTPEMPSVRKAWTTRSVYIPDQLEQQLDKKMRDLQDKIGDEVRVQKTRHFYPLVFYFGVNNLLEKSNSELIEVLEQVDPDLDDYRR
jgi:hypothetical protein